MQYGELGALGRVSRLVLGGGGIGQVWGPTDRAEGIATIYAALDAGIDMLDTAPSYNICEELIAEAFKGRTPADLKLTTKCVVGSPAPEDVYPLLRHSLETSLRAMQVDHVDILFLHNEICADDFVYRDDNDRRSEFATSWTLYRDAVVPALERLVSEGLARHWGITGAAIGRTILDALEHTRPPHVVQAVTNLLDSPGGQLHRGADQRHRDIIARADALGIGVMGIRAVQAGALTRGFDRPVDDASPDAADYRRTAPFRALCARWGADPALIAHRYALSMPGVHTVILGVKNRSELAEIISAAAEGSLRAEEISAIDGIGLRVP